MLQDSITAFIRPVSSSPDGEPNTEPLPQSTTMNDCLHCYEAPALPDIVYCADCLKMYQDEYAASQLPQCFLCWRHAEHIYVTTSFRWLGRYWPSEERPLCRLHWLLALGVHLESVFIRKQVNEDYEHGESEAVA